MTARVYPPCRRILLTLEYDGTAYSGWQRQQGVPSVQQTLEEALAKCTRERIAVMGASRTDAGVHALGQRAHFDTFGTIPAEKFPFVLNTLLPFDIRVREGAQVHPLFHARFDARGKIYTYRIHNAPHAGALTRNTHAHVPGRTLDEARMYDAAQRLVGRHDFAAFAAAGSVAKSTVRTIERIDIARDGSDLTLTVRGNAFLYNMVRILAGTLIGIGQGKLPPDVLDEALATGNRLCLGVTAPAHGLELTRIFYDHES